MDGILVLDKGNNIIDFNQKFIDMWKIPPSILETKNGGLVLDSITHKAQAPDNLSQIMKLLSQQPDLIRTEKFNCNDNRCIELYSQPYLLESKPAGRIWNFRDITKRVLLEEKIQYQATHDALTQLPNRILLMERIHQEITKSKKDLSIFSILFLTLIDLS